jgi:hypothetical protein
VQLLLDPFAGFSGKSGGQIRRTIGRIRLRPAADPTQQMELVVGPAAVAAHPQMHADQEAGAQGQGGVHAVGDLLGDFVAAEHPMSHVALASTGWPNPAPSRHLRSSMRAR